MLRVEKELTQTQLGDEIGVSRRTVQDWEANRKSPSDNHREKLEDFFDIPSFELLKDAGQIAYANLAVAILRNNELTVPVLLDAAVKLGAVKPPEPVEDEATPHPLAGIVGKKGTDGNV